MFLFKAENIEAMNGKIYSTTNQLNYDNISWTKLLKLLNQQTNHQH